MDDENRESCRQQVDCTDLLGQLGESQKAHLFKLGVVRTNTKDETICCLDSKNDNAHFVLEGRVKIYELTPEGKEIILWFCSPGELFGFAETSLAHVSGGQRVNAQACGYTRLLIVKSQEFRQFILNQPSIILPLIQLLGYRLYDIIGVLSDITSADVASRVVRLLLKLGERYGKTVERGLHLDIPLTHQEMADMIGTSRQTVTTVLGELKRQGMISIEQRSVIIRDIDWLQRGLNYSKFAGRTLDPVVKGGLANADL